ncbi:hypothetical protein AAVH_08140 [Aphelenchoides avenae]|nr:hypothetical protein AAVH_08140 [Aphelenchus avenae]
MSWYFTTVVLLVFFCYHVHSKGPKSTYKQVTKNNHVEFGYNDILEFRGKNEISIKLTTANKDKTTDLAIKLTEKAGKVLSFDVVYGAKPECLKTTTAQFHFGEQVGIWTDDSDNFRVKMLRDTVDPVVPFKLGKKLQITVDPKSTYMTVECGAEHNWANNSVINHDVFKRSTLYTPKFYLDTWTESKECKTPTAQQFVKIVVVRDLLLNLTGLWKDQLKKKKVMVSLIPAVTAYDARNHTHGDYFFLVAPSVALYGGKKAARDGDIVKAGNVLKDKIVSSITKIAVGGPSLTRDDAVKYGFMGQYLGEGSTPRDVVEVTECTPGSFVCPSSPCCYR